MRPNVRKSAPGVRGGKVQKKNRTALSPDFYEHDLERLVVQRIRPARGFYHAITPTEVRRFIGIVPDWGEVASDVRAVVLTAGDDWCYGRYHNAGIIKLDAWPKDEAAYIPRRKEWLVRAIGIDEPYGASGWDLLLGRDQVRCFLLLGTFLHELGHHVDRMGTRSKTDASNGEPFAIAYEHRRQRELWDAYVREFGDPSH